jgi:pheromone shutdown protein TraB
MTLWDKVSLFFSFLMSFNLNINAEDIEKLKDDDIITYGLKQLTESHPALARPLLTERDIYLTNVLQRIPASTIVAVVGMMIGIFSESFRRKRARERNCKRLGLC